MADILGAVLSPTDAAGTFQVNSAADPGPLLEAQFAYWQRPQIHPDTRQLLATTLPVCAVSNIDRADLAAALAHHELAGHFTHLVTSQDARAYKPRPEMFTTALRLLGLGPHEVIHAGDSLTSDVAEAARLGIPAAWVNRKRRPAPGTSPSPTYEVTDPSRATCPARWLKRRRARQLTAG